MPDPRFFPAPQPLRLDAVAELTGATLARAGAAGVMITGCAPLSVAGPGDISFLGAPKYLAALETSAAGACFMTEKLAARAGTGAEILIHPAPQQAYVMLARRFYPDAMPEPGIAAAAQIAASATIGAGCRIDGGAVIADGARIGDGSWIGPNAVIGAACELGAGARIGANVSISHTIAGARLRVLPGASVGQDGYSFVPGDAGLVRIPQLGRVMIGDDVEIGASTTIDRGAGDDTVIGNGTKIDNLVQVGHNCRIGHHCVLVAQVGLSGSVVLGDGVMVGGHTGIADHVTVGAGAKLAAGTGVYRDIPAGAAYAGIPAKPVKEWHRETVLLKQLRSREKD